MFRHWLHAWFLLANLMTEVYRRAVNLRIGKNEGSKYPRRLGRKAGSSSLASQSKTADEFLLLQSNSGVLITDIRCIIDVNLTKNSPLSSRNVKSTRETNYIHFSSRFRRWSIFAAFKLVIPIYFAIFTSLSLSSFQSLNFGFRISRDCKFLKIQGWLRSLVITGCMHKYKITT